MRPAKITALIVMLLLCVSLTNAWAEPVRIRILVGPREVPLSPAPVYDGQRVLAPLGVLNYLEADFITNSNKSNVALVADDGSSEAIDTIKVDDNEMIPIDKVLEIIGGESELDLEKRTLTLTAHLKSVEFVDGTLKVNCSFPVSYSVGDWSDKLWVDFDSTKVATEAKEVHVGGDVVKKARLGQFKEDTARVVLDLAKDTGYKVESGPVAAQAVIKVSPKLAKVVPIVHKSHTASSGGGAPFTVQSVRVQNVSDNEFNLILTTSSKATVWTAYGVLPPQVVLHLKSGTISDAAKAVQGEHPLLKKLTFKNSQVQLDLSRIVVHDLQVGDNAIILNIKLPKNAGGTLAGKIIVIDPGHGGSQPGAKYGSVLEKDLNMRISNQLASKLKALGARVVMTRTSDTELGLAARPEMAVNHRADFFISVHCNSNGRRNSATGIETYYHMNEASPRALAYALHAGMLAYTGMQDRRARSDSSLYSRGLAVLRGLENTGIPGVLLECGYVNHDADRKKLVDSNYRDKLTDGVIAGLKAYVEGTAIR